MPNRCIGCFVCVWEWGVRVDGYFCYRRCAMVALSYALPLVNAFLGVDPMAHSDY